MNYGIILARLDSTRLPGKALYKLGNKRLIDWCIDSAKKVKNIKVVLATTDREVDNDLEHVAKEKEILIFRGDTENIAKRVMDCIKKFNIKNFARINGDSPFINSSLLSTGFSKIDNFDMVTNLVPRTYPYGMTVEIFNSQFYMDNMKNFVKPSHFEHITSYFYENINKFKVFYMKKMQFNCHNVRLAVDTEDDLKFLNIFLKKFPGIENEAVEKIAENYNQIS